MKVKFCGMTNYEDVRDAIDLGVDYIGFVFYGRSKRFISIDDAKSIVEKVKGNVKTVGVFFGWEKENIVEAFNCCKLDFAQVYEPLSGIDTITVYRIKDKLPEKVEDGLLLFDVYTEKGGGSGEQFNWDILSGFKEKQRLFVAGGVNKDNVVKLKRLGIYGVDLVSSIEEYPGKKSKQKMKEFMDVVRS